jgi:hypothetical protein
MEIPYVAPKYGLSAFNCDVYRTTPKREKSSPVLPVPPPLYFAYAFRSFAKNSAKWGATSMTTSPLW